MTFEKKKRLIEELSIRLPFQVQYKYKDMFTCTLRSIEVYPIYEVNDIVDYYVWIDGKDLDLDDVKVLLVKEEKTNEMSLEYLLKNHLDFRGSIEMGIAENK